MSLQSSGIRTVFFPPNVTDLIQPMDQGIVESINRRYRHVILTSLLDECENNSSEAILDRKSFNLRNNVFNIAGAWDNVKKNYHSKELETNTAIG